MWSDALLPWVACSVLVVGLASGQLPSSSSTVGPGRVAELRAKYTTGGAIVRDMDHIRHDLQQVIALSGDGTFTVDEAIFYLMRMHDFDDNNQLDGLEVMRAFSHAHGSSSEDNDHEDPPLETLTQLVDETMRYDINHDGLLSYAEWMQGYKSGQGV